MGALIALATPLLVACLATLLLAQDGSNEVVLVGIPRDELVGLERAPTSEASVTSDAALEKARREATGTRNGEVRQMALGRYSDEAVEYLRGRLVWVISFEPDPRAPVLIIGPIGFDHSCDWAFHHEYILTILDAETGEVLSSGGGAYFDPSLPPTFHDETSGDRAYCDLLIKGERWSDRSP